MTLVAPGVAYFHLLKQYIYININLLYIHVFKLINVMITQHDAKKPTVDKLIACLED